MGSNTSICVAVGVIRAGIIFLGRSAFVPEAIPLLTQWIHRFNS